MTFHAVLAFLGAVMCSSLAVFAICENRRAFVPWIFAAGMSVLALMEVCTGISTQAVQPADVIAWKKLSCAASAFLPGVWLLFSLSFASSNYQELITKWKYIVLVAFALPLGLTTFFYQELFTTAASLQAASRVFFPLGWSGYSLHLCLLLSSVVILMNLERTLRAFAGSTRWQVKFRVSSITTGN